MKAFDTQLALDIIAEELNWKGPVSPGHKREDPEGVGCLFPELSDKPVAAASLGQVRVVPYLLLHESFEARNYTKYGYKRGVLTLGFRVFRV